MADNIKIMTEKEIQNEIKALKNLFSVVFLIFNSRNFSVFDTSAMHL